MTDHFKQPVLGARVFIAETAYVGGDVTLGEECTVMHHVTIRGDIAPIRIGARASIQDGAVLHTPDGTPLDIADDVGVAHRAVVHGRRIGARTLIGIGAVLLDDCQIGSRCVIAAGAVVTPGMTVPDGKVVMGTPGRIVRDATKRDLAMIDEVIRNYRRLNRLHAAGHFPNIAGR